MLRGSPQWKRCFWLFQPHLPGWSNENVPGRHWWCLAAGYSACAAFWSPLKLAGKAGSDSLHGQEPQKLNQIASSSPVCLSAFVSGYWAQRPLLRGLMSPSSSSIIRRSRTASDLLFFYCFFCIFMQIGQNHIYQYVPSNCWHIHACTHRSARVFPPKAR